MSRFIAIDGNSLMFRAYYALMGMTTKTGIPTGALHGFISMLYKLIDYKPSHIVVAFDMPTPTFRHKQYAEYKAGRQKTPEDLLKQFPLIKQILNSMGIAVCECEGYEADDIIGTFSKLANEHEIDTLLVTGDRDAFQLINEHTHVLITKTGMSDVIEFDEAALMEKYGLAPSKMVDLKGLMGDTSDNLPGIVGVGEKTALKLLGKYGSFEQVFVRGITEEKGALRDKIENGADGAHLSYNLGIIDTNVPMKTTVDDCVFNAALIQGARGIMNELQLRGLIERMPIPKGASDVAQENVSAIPTNGLKNVDIESIQQLSDVVEQLAGALRVAIHLGEQITICSDFTTQYRIAIGGTLLEAGLGNEEVLQTLKPVFESNAKKLVFDGKSLMHKLADLNIKLNNLYFDAMIVDYLINAVSPSNSLTELINEKASGTAPDAYALFILCDSMMCELSTNGLLPLYKDIELPLITVLFDMEKTGFCIDTDVMAQMSKLFGEQKDELETQIYALAGETFNILSPKQLGIVLFEKLGLPPKQKTKQGYSTSAEVLESLIEYPIAALVLEYRFVAKLKSTFVDGLVQLIDRDTGRIHTTFNQNVAVTGRISSTEPNLQNIPVRTELGREIRRAFVAQSGSKLLDADYSQIELRILAHMSRDPAMIEAFCTNSDIHTRTAAEVFAVPEEEVTREQRSAAKAVNFGIVYGISDYGLAKNLGIGRKQAARYIELYFNRYTGIAEYMKTSVENAKAEGSVKTLLGRRRSMFELTSSNFNTRSFGERVARNMPIQGTAADIIKLAMVRVHKALSDNNLSAKLVLQIHDELIIETPQNEVDAVSKILRDCMQNAIELSVPLVADVNVGDNWYDAK